MNISTPKIYTKEMEFDPAKEFASHLPSLVKPENYYGLDWINNGSTLVISIPETLSATELIEVMSCLDSLKSKFKPDSIQKKFALGKLFIKFSWWR